MKKLLLLAFLSSGTLSTQAEAGGVAVRFGPPGVGGGGPNPVAIPPALTDLGLSYVTSKGLSFDASLTALAVARRSRVKGGSYVSLGAGMIFSVSGTGFGPYAGFGYEGGCVSWLGCFSAEFNQGLGFGVGRIISPYGVRVGVIKWF